MKFDLFKVFTGETSSTEMPEFSESVDVCDFRAFWPHSTPKDHDYSQVPRFRADVTEKQFLELIEFVGRINTGTTLISERSLFDGFHTLSQEMRDKLTVADIARQEALKCLRSHDTDMLAVNYEGIILSLSQGEDIRSELANGRISNRARTSMYCTVINTFNWALSFTYPQYDPMFILPICVAISSPHPEFGTMPDEELFLMAAASDKDLLDQVLYRPCNGVGISASGIASQLQEIRNTLSLPLLMSYQLVTPARYYVHDSLKTNSIIALLISEDYLTRWCLSEERLLAPFDEDEREKLRLAQVMHFVDQQNESKYLPKTQGKWPKTCTVLNAGSGVYIPAFRVIDQTGLVSIITPASKKTMALLRRAYGLPEFDILKQLPPALCDVGNPASEEFPCIIERLTGGVHDGLVDIEDYMDQLSTPCNVDEVSMDYLFHKFLTREKQYV